MKKRKIECGDCYIGYHRALGVERFYLFDEDGVLDLPVDVNDSDEGFYCAKKLCHLHIGNTVPIAIKGWTFEYLGNCND